VNGGATCAGVKFCTGMDTDELAGDELACTSSGENLGAMVNPIA
jgi:hypothetical protein